jgi:type 1 fimbria pilin
VNDAKATKQCRNGTAVTAGFFHRHVQRLACLSAWWADAFSGEVIADACEVQAGDRTLTVSMGQVSSNRFHRVGEDTDPVPFHIQLLNCNTNVSRYVAIQFRGVGDGKQPDVLSIGEGPGIATNVGVALFDRQGCLFPSTVRCQQPGRNYRRDP